MFEFFDIGTERLAQLLAVHSALFWPYEDLRWNGNRSGESTRIWDMNWLPREGRPICSIKNNPPVWVRQLIDQTSRRWNKQILMEFFTPLDIESIRLCTAPVEDYWAWHHEKLGMFTVRSAYRMLAQARESMTASQENSASRSDTMSARKEWRELWRIGVP